MPNPRSRKSEPEPQERTVVGFIGSAELDFKALGALLDDALPDGDVLFVIDATKDGYTDSVAGVVKYATTCKPPIPYEVFSDEAASKTRGMKSVFEDATDDFDPGEVGVAKALTEYLGNMTEQDVRLYVFLADPPTDEDVAVVEEAEAANLTAHDLCAGLEEISFSDPSSSEPAAEPEPEKPSRRRRGADDDDEPKAKEKTYTEAQLRKITAVELKQMLRDDFDFQDSQIKGMDKDAVIDAYIQAQKGDDAPSGHVQNDDTPMALEDRPRRGRGAAAATQDELPLGDDEEGSDEAQALFQSGSFVPWEDFGQLVVGIDPLRNRVAQAAAIHALALADYMRAPKSAGRPRSDGTPAQPRAEEDKPARRRRSADD